MMSLGIRKIYTSNNAVSFSIVYYFSWLFVCFSLSLLFLWRVFHSLSCCDTKWLNRILLVGKILTDGLIESNWQNYNNKSNWLDDWLYFEVILFNFFQLKLLHHSKNGCYSAKKNIRTKNETLLNAIFSIRFMFSSCEKNIHQDFMSFHLNGLFAMVFCTWDFACSAYKLRLTFIYLI